jgi:hypothetical protein
MKIHLSREEKRGIFGKVKFQVHGRIELSDRERELVNNYKLRKHELFAHQLGNSDSTISIDVGCLTGDKAFTFVVDDIARAVDLETKINDAAEGLKAYLNQLTDVGRATVREL